MAAEQARSLGTRWYWEDMTGWHGPLSRESAQSASDKFGIGSEIRPYKTYGLSQKAKDMMAEQDAEDAAAEAAMTDAEKIAEAADSGERFSDRVRQFIFPAKRNEDGTFRL